ncbi:MarR family winged helix-turn-helix transcriptional regulator [Microbacterium arabinogalactanolyticum]|uniref:MarR family transcriptional regulator n=1 Tax=Microbacterium arabinogalactanolyticum TaxID=69365 RepID=A0ABQ5NF57_9MICO|nr:MarR family winged helix-turn-helix transcriptional regulator [Microbacterium arabinogalactanolyticum]GLC84272.1 MarR family transcriptional regulator [Microbacterium arabinogalactanolyticum]
MPADRTRTTPTPAQLRVWREYIETADALRRTLDGRMLSESGMSSGDYAVLLALSEAPRRTLRSSELADAVGWERSRLSHHLRRMEGRGLIMRDASEAEARGVEVAITAAGLELFRAGSVSHLRAVKELFVDALSPQQLDDAGGIAAALRRTTGDTPGLRD